MYLKKQQKQYIEDLRKVLGEKNKIIDKFRQTNVNWYVIIREIR